MSKLPCIQRTFPLQVNRLTYIQHYLVWIKHLVERIGYDNTQKVWETTFNNYDHTVINSILSAGWNQVSNSDPITNEKIERLISDSFSLSKDDKLLNKIKITLENTPPTIQIQDLFGNDTYEKEISAYDALLLLFDGQACLAEATIEKFGKQGELIVYDIMIKSRLATNIATGSVEEFIEGFTSIPSGKNIFTASLEIEVIEKSENHATVFVKECEWARYFRDHHPGVGYLIACSTDEVAYRAFNSNLRMQRTETLMEGASKCDFRVYSTDNPL